MVDRSPLRKNVTGGMFDRTGPLASILRYVVDKVKLFCSELRPVIPMSISRIKVPNKSLSYELNNIFFRLVA